jgi:hypothetical protein
MLEIRNVRETQPMTYRTARALAGLRRIGAPALAVAWSWAPGGTAWAQIAEPAASDSAAPAAESGSASAAFPAPDSQTAPGAPAPAPVEPAAPEQPTVAAAPAPSRPDAPTARVEHPATPEPEPTLMGGEFFLGVPVGFLSKGIQREEGLAASGWGIDLGGTFQYWWLNGMLDAGFEHYADSKAFNVMVVDNFGRSFEAESRLNFSYFAPSVGLKTPVIAVIDPYLGVTVGAQVGYSFPFDTSRQIVNCDDCPKDHVKVTGGPFVEPILELLWPAQAGAQLGLASSWQEYVGESDYEHKLVFRGVIQIQNNPEAWK